MRWRSSRAELLRPERGTAAAVAQSAGLDATERPPSSNGRGATAMRQAVISGVLILAALHPPPAAWAGSSLPRDGDEWMYFGGAVEAAHVPTSQRVGVRLLPAVELPGAGEAPQRLRGAALDAPGREGLVQAADMTRGVPVGDDGRFEANVMSLSRPVRGSLVYETARLEAGRAGAGRLVLPGLRHRARRAPAHTGRRWLIRGVAVPQATR